MNSSLNVLYIFDDNYAIYSDVSIVSLLENNKDLFSITIYILDNEISDISKKRIQKTVDKYKRQLIYIDTESINKLLKEYRIPTYRGSSSTNMKLFALDVIEEDIDRILYLDSDTIVTGNVEELMDIDMKGHPIGMVLDSVAYHHKKYIGFKENDKYYNAGMILYDVKTWRNNHCTKHIIKHVKNKRAHYPATDQDIFNVVFKKDIFILNLKYNLQPFHLIYDNKTYCKYFGYDNYYSNEEIMAAKEKPCILHTFRYIGEFPWHKNSCHPCVKQFDYYLRLSEWPDYEKRCSNSGLILKLEKCLYKALPLQMFIRIFNCAFKTFAYRSNKLSEKEIQIKQI